MPIEHVFLDMDGVLADFFHPALARHGRADLAAAWPVGVRDMAGTMGVTWEAFWAPLVADGAAFWADLPALPWLDDLLRAVERHAPWTVLTRPHPEPCCVAGKVAWMNRHLAPRSGDRHFERFVLTRSKRWLAAPGRVLIDDSEAMVASFRAAGGDAVLFPQPWNAGHATGDPLAAVLGALDALAARG
jgi:beta-phosphoglucomutase-like phosphatase (HAD superfamily)